MPFIEHIDIYRERYTHTQNHNMICRAQYNNTKKKQNPNKHKK
jgi:hypothetical protein